MKTGRLLAISLLLAGAMAIFAYFTAGSLPEGAQLPTHFNAAGQADAFAPAMQALLVPVGLVLFVALIFALIPRLEPLQDRLEASAPVLRTVWVGMLLIALLIQAMIALPAYGLDLPITLIPLGVGLFLILLGNVLPKSRPGFFVGIRTPWAIMDTDNWIATHRLGGKLMMAAGAIIVAVSLLPIGEQARSAVFLGAIAFAVVPPLVYSWWLWQRGREA